MWHDIDGWWAVWMLLMMVVFWGGFIALAIWAAQAVFPRRNDDALAIARRRYASGEITREDFDRISHDLQAHA